MRRRQRARRTLVVVTIAVITLAAAGCGSSGKSAAKHATTTTEDGDRDAFCRDNDLLNAASASAKSLAEVAKIFKANVGIIDDFGDQAPAKVRADAHALVLAAHKVITTGNAKGFGTTAVAAAGQRIDTFCTDTAAPTTT